MASCQRATSFTVAAAMAVACIICSLVAATSAIDYPQGPSNVLTIQNTFHMRNLTVQCHSDVVTPHCNVMHIVLPQEAYMLPLDPKVQHRWTCTLSMEKTKGALCSHVQSGEFTMWENRSPPMCDRNCPWFAGPDGLSLIRHQGTKPVHVYNWPSHNNALHNC